MAKKLKYELASIDFDGTIATDPTPEEWPNTGVLIPKAKEVILKYRELGGQIIIFTCREGHAKQNCKDFLDKHGIPYDKINENMQERVDRWNNDCRKVGADVYIDNLNLGGLDWDLVEKELLMLIDVD